MRAATGRPHAGRHMRVTDGCECIDVRGHRNGIGRRERHRAWALRARERHRASPGRLRAVTRKNHDFAAASSIQQLLSGRVSVALLAVGETMVLVTRNVDLSVGSTLGLSRVRRGQPVPHHPHIPVGPGS